MQSLFAAITISAITRIAGADQRAAPPCGSSELVVRQAHRQNRVVHPDYSALSAGAILLSVGYAIALSVPIRKGFDENSGRLAIPAIGPWLRDPTWGWALDGLMQLGGAAFIVDAFINPIVVLGTPEAQLHTPAGVQHLLRISMWF